MVFWQQKLITRLIWLLVVSLPVCVHAATLRAVLPIDTAPDAGVRLVFDEAVPEASHFGRVSPALIVVDLPQTTVGLDKENRQQQFSDGLLTEWQVAESYGHTRVALTLLKLPIFDVTTKGNELWVTWQSSAPTLSSQREVTQKPTITDFQFSQRYPQVAVLKFKLSHHRAALDSRLTENGVRLSIQDAVLPKRFEKAFEVSDFGTLVEAVQLNQSREGVQVDVITTAPFNHVLYQVEDELWLELSPLTLGQPSLSTVEHFQGEKISLNFQDIEVRSVLQLLADFTGLNIVASDAVTGRITLRLQQVPWDQALDIILRSKGLDKRITGDVILIGPHETLAQRDAKRMQAAQSVQALAPLQSDYIQVNYARADDLAALIRQESQSLLSERGAVSVDERTNTLLVQDVAEKIAEMRRLVNRLDVPVKQVLIESRVVIANDDFNHTLGLAFGAASNPKLGSSPVFGVSGNLADASTIALGADPSTVTVANRLISPLNPLTLNGTLTTASAGLTIARLPGDTLLDLELAALESEGTGQVVSAPRLMTSNQQTAHIEQGVEIPYLEASASGAASISFKKAVLKLEVTPQITPNDHVVLDLIISKDSQGADTDAGPAINKQEVKTRVLVDNGETLVLGGIYEQTKQLTVNRVPGLGRVPYLGRLFRNETTRDERRELLIFVTPKIIEDALTTGIEAR